MPFVHVCSEMGWSSVDICPVLCATAAESERETAHHLGGEGKIVIDKLHEKLYELLDAADPELDPEKLAQWGRLIRAFGVFGVNTVFRTNVWCLSPTLQFLMTQDITLLHFAVAWENEPLTRLLLDCGASPNMQSHNSEGFGKNALCWSPLTVACSLDNVNLVRVLIRAGALVHQQRSICLKKEGDSQETAVVDLLHLCRIVKSEKCLAQLSRKLPHWADSRFVAPVFRDLLDTADILPWMPAWPLGVTNDQVLRLTLGTNPRSLLNALLAEERNDELEYED